MPKTRILIIEDMLSNAELYKSFLSHSGYDSEIAGTGNKGLGLLAGNSYSALVLDLHLPDMNGRDILKQVQLSHPHMPVIVVTAYGSINNAVECLQLGAVDFLTKPFSSARLVTTIENALKQEQLKREVHQLRRETAQEKFQSFIGTSPAMQAVYRQIEAMATSKASIFITGESGTGKEMAARAIHDLSPRASKPFIAINCAAIPKDLLESHIFGHVKGAFTGATQNRKGAALAANGGTLFLDEIAEMPLDLQAKMLRFIQTGTITPVGSSNEEAVDIRFISATNRAIVEEVRQGHFREDLFYRLHVVPLEMPALREREDDIILLANHFLQHFAKVEKRSCAYLEPDALEHLRKHNWPGNVRELENTIHHIVVMNNATGITDAMLPEQLKIQADSAPDQHQAEATGPFLVKPLWQIEKEAILKAMRACDDDIPKAAALLQVSPSTIYRKIHIWRGNEQELSHKIRA